MEDIIRSERSHLQEVCLHRDRKQIGGCRELEGKGMRRAYLIGTGFALGVMKCFGMRKRWWLHNFVNVLNATEWHTLK